MTEPTPGHEHAKGLVDSIKAKKCMDELLALVKKIPETSSDEEDMDYSQGTDVNCLNIVSADCNFRIVA